MYGSFCLFFFLFGFFLHFSSLRFSFLFVTVGFCFVVIFFLYIKHLRSRTPTQHKHRLPAPTPGPQPGRGSGAPLAFLWLFSWCLAPVGGHEGLGRWDLDSSALGRRSQGRKHGGEDDEVWGPTKTDGAPKGAWDAGGGRRAGRRRWGGQVGLASAAATLCSRGAPPSPPSTPAWT